MPYTFALTVKKDNSLLALEQDGQSIATKEWPEQRDMGKQLFQAIAELLAANNLKPEEVSDFIVESAMPDNSTSMRIAETVKQVYTFGVREKIHTSLMPRKQSEQE